MRELIFRGLSINKDMYYGLLSISTFREGVVIGNIYENPKLLETK